MSLSLQPLTSADNPRLREYRRLVRDRRYRERKQALALEGPHLVRAALDACLRAKVVFYAEGYLKGEGSKWPQEFKSHVRQFVLPDKLFRDLAETRAPRAVSAIFELPPPGYRPACKSISETPVLVVDRIQDPGNFGSILRTAAAAGINRVCYGRGTVDPWSPKVLRATAGSIFQVNLDEVADLYNCVQSLKKDGLQIVAATGKGRVGHREAPYRQPLALLIGNEGRGLGEELLASADLQVAIFHCPGVESLNAAAACAVLLFEITARRR